MANPNGFFSILFKRLFTRIIENLSSFKTWMFLLPFTISTIVLYWLVYKNIIMCNSILSNQLLEYQYLFIHKIIASTEDMFIAWCTFNVSLATVIVSAREMFKASKVKALAKDGDADGIKNVAS